METLPEPPFCIILQYIITERVRMEYMFREHTQITEKCAPIALKEVLNYTSRRIRSIPRMTVPRGRLLLNYLRIMWRKMSYNDKLVHAATNNFVHLVPYLLTLGADTNYSQSEALRIAVRTSPKIVELLIFPPHSVCHERLDGIGDPLWTPVDIHAGDDAALYAASQYGTDEAAESIDLLIKAGVGEAAIIKILNRHHVNMRACRQLVPHIPPQTLIIDHNRPCSIM